MRKQRRKPLDDTRAAPQVHVRPRQRGVARPQGDSCDIGAYEVMLTTEVGVDIKPESCPNPLNVKGKGLLPVAILGTSEFDVTQVGSASVTLEGTSPLRLSVEDSAIPYEPYLGKQGSNDCIEYYLDEYGVYDGILDLTLKFDTQEVVAALGEVRL